MYPLQGRVQAELPRPLSCGKLGTSKAKISDLPEKYIRVIRAMRSDSSGAAWREMVREEAAMYNAARSGF